MILISENKDYKYFAVAENRDSTNFSIEEFNDRGSYVLHSKTVEGYRAIYPLGIHAYSPEIIGVLVDGEEIPEEIAFEILYDGCKFQDGNIKPFTPFPPGAISELKSLIKSKGILIDNPIDEPNKAEFIDPIWCRSGECKAYQDSVKEFESYESKLVKAVIIKVKLD